MATSGGITVVPARVVLAAIEKPRLPVAAMRSTVTVSTRASGGASARSAAVNAASAGRTALGLDDDPVAVVQHETVESLPQGEAVDERPETDALNDTADAESGALLRRHVASVAEDRCRASRRARSPPAGRPQDDRGRHRCRLTPSAARLVPEETALQDSQDQRDRARRRCRRSSRRSPLAATACSARRCATARSSTTISSRRPSCPSAGQDVQEAGTYRLERRDDEARFGYAVGPHSWKQFLLPARVELWQARRDADGGFDVEEEPLERPPLALIGVRACELHGIAIQDRVLLGGRYADPRLRRTPRGHVHRRRQLLRAGRPPASASRWAPGRRPSGLRPRADRDPRRRAPPAARGRQRARRRGRGGAAAHVRRPRTTSRRRRRGRRCRRAAWVAASTRPHPRPARSQPRAPSAGTTSPSAASPAATARWSARPASARASRTTPSLAGDEAERDAPLGLLLLGRPLVHPRRQHPPVGHAPGTASG